MMTAVLKEVALQEVVRFHYGSALRTDQRDESGDILVYGSNGPVGRHSEPIVSQPTLIIGRKGAVGAVHYAPTGGWPIDTTYYTEIIDKSQLDLLYLYYALKQSRLERHTIVTSIPGLNRKSLEQTKIPLPPLPEQKRIADILDKADAIRRKRREAIKQLHYLIESRFLEIIGDPVANPHDWPSGTFDDRLTLVQYGPRFYNKAYSASGVRIVRITDLDFQGRLDYSAMPLMDISAEDEENFLLASWRPAARPKRCHCRKNGVD